MSEKIIPEIAVVGIDIGKTSFHVIGLDRRGAVVLRQRWSRSQVAARFANMPPCLIGMEACVGAHHLSRKLQMLGHDARLMPAKYVRPYSKGQKNDFRDAEAIAEAVQRPTMKFVATKTADQLDLQALHRVRERLVGQRPGSGWCRNRYRLATARSSAASRGAAIAICAVCSFRLPGSCWSRSGRSIGTAMGSSRGSRPLESDCTTTCWRLRSRTSSPASPGQFSTRGAPSSASGQMR